MSKKIKDIVNKNFFQPNWYSILINPYFIARRGLFLAIKRFANEDFSNRSILDVGCGIKPYQNLFKNVSQYIGIDIKGGGHYDQAKCVDQFYDGKSIPFADESFNAVICTQVLEHVTDPEVLLREINRVLRPGGKIFLTMPFVWNEHETPYDFRRFTSYGHENIFKSSGLKIKKIETNGGVFRVCGQLISAFIFEKLTRKNSLIKFLVSCCLCFPVQLLFIFMDTIFKNSWITLDYIIIAEK